MEPIGGAEKRSLEMRRLLSDHAEVTLWSEYPAVGDSHEKARCRQINIRKLAFPRSGVFIFVGTYFWVGNWLRLAKPSKIIVIFNVPEMDSLRRFLRRLRDLRVKCPIQLVYAAQWMANKAGLPGKVIPSPIDLTCFTPRLTDTRTSGNFVVGRLSRDTRLKHHPDDPDLYRALALLGFRVRIMGGLVLSDHLTSASGVELMPAGAEPPELFLKSLDCFIFRTAPEWFEPSGRVVAEAMASGLPVVCGMEGGYIEYIRHGQNGFLFSTNHEAIDYIEALHKSHELRQGIGAAARSAMELIFSPRQDKEFLNFVLSRDIQGDISSLLKDSGAWGYRL